MVGYLDVFQVLLLLSSITLVVLTLYSFIKYREYRFMMGVLCFYSLTIVIRYALLIIFKLDTIILSQMEIVTINQMSQVSQLFILVSAIPTTIYLIHKNNKDIKIYKKILSGG